MQGAEGPPRCDRVCVGGSGVGKEPAGEGGEGGQAMGHLVTAAGAGPPGQGMGASHGGDGTSAWEAVGA